tara:strand:+ start:314 stop:493 length:180 start_codon:yes stop_codon:yes gene_type:complete
MAKELSEDTAVQLSLKTLGGIATLITILVGMWFTLQADIAEARECQLLQIQKLQEWSLI